MSTQAVFEMQTASPTFSPVAHGMLQRCTATQECDECRKKRLGTLQRAAVNASPVSEVPPIVHEVLRSSGQPLDAQTRAFMEPRFGHDFSSVRVHTDAKAAESAEELNALAYTVGRDVIFGTLQYAPNSVSGRRLLAHELAHTVQQTNTVGSMKNPLHVGPVDDDFEREAEVQATRIAEASTRDEVWSSLSFAEPSLQRQPAPKTQSEKTSCMTIASKRVFSRGNDDPAECQYETARTTVSLMFDPCACSQKGATSIPLRLEYLVLMGGKSFSDEAGTRPETQASTIATNMNLEETGGGATSGTLIHSEDEGKKPIPGDPGDTLSQSLDLKTSLPCMGGNATGSVGVGAGVGARRYTAETINWSITTSGKKVTAASIRMDETTPTGRVITPTRDVTGRQKAYPKFPGDPRDQGCACHKVTGVQYGKNCKPKGGAGFGSGGGG